MQDPRNALNRSRTGKNLFFKFICPDLRMELNGCRQRLLFTGQLIQRKCGLCSQGRDEDDEEGILEYNLSSSNEDSEEQSLGNDNDKGVRQ